MKPITRRRLHRLWRRVVRFFFGPWAEPEPAPDEWRVKVKVRTGLACEATLTHVNTGQTWSAVGATPDEAVENIRREHGVNPSMVVNLITLKRRSNGR